MARTKLFFVSDVHGSDRCFKKFLNAGKFYGASVLVLGGDITGKMIVPIVDQGDGTYKSAQGGKNAVLKSHKELDEASNLIRDSGFYPYLCSAKEYEELEANPDLVKRLFNKMMVEGIQRWMVLAEERLKSTGIKCYISPGNDDILDIDPVLNSASYVVNPEEKVFDIDGKHEMITLGTVNHTPWHSPREVDEDVLLGKIEAMCSNIRDMKNAIFNIHVPPIDTIIDQAPKLDANLKPDIQGGETVMISAGSVATRKSIENHQPLIGLHGHIHESKGVTKIGKTLCANPGSEYGEGILKGFLCDLDDGKIKSYMLTSG